MALTGLVDNQRFLRTDKPALINGVNYGDGKLIINGRYDYQPLNGLVWDDETNQICNTEFVTDYSRKIYEVNSGTITLIENRVYKILIDKDTTFVLPIPKNKNINNEIMVTIYYTMGTVDFGSDTFFDGEVPSFSNGNYNIYYDFDPLQDKWVAGVLAV